MRRLTGITAWGATVALTCALGLVPLTACSSSDEAAAPAEEQAQDETAEEPEAEPEDEAPAEEEAVWVMTGQTHHSEFPGQEPNDMAIAFELDDAGNTVKEFFDGDETMNEYQYDENGWLVSIGYGDNKVTYENEYDELGRLVSQVGSDGGETTYTYGENGNIASQTSKVIVTSYDENGEEIEGSERTQTNVCEYDENGYIKRRTIENDGNTHVIEYTYELDETGLPTSYTQLDYTANDDEAGKYESVYSLTFDENGNLTKVESSDESEVKIVTEFTYTLVEHPSLAASINAKTKSL